MMNSGFLPLSRWRTVRPWPHKDGERVRRSFIFLIKLIGQSITVSHRCEVMSDLKQNIPPHTLDFLVKPKKLIESALVPFVQYRYLVWFWTTYAHCTNLTGECGTNVML